MTYNGSISEFNIYKIGVKLEFGVDKSESLIRSIVILYHFNFHYDFAVSQLIKSGFMKLRNRITKA